jgi:hypothetical protein
MKAAVLRLCPPKDRPVEQFWSNSSAARVDAVGSVRGAGSSGGRQALHIAAEGGLPVVLLVGSEIVLQGSSVPPVELRKKVVACLRGLRIGNQSISVPVHVVASAGPSLQARDVGQEVICVR